MIDNISNNTTLQYTNKKNMRSNVSDMFHKAWKRPLEPSALSFKMFIRVATVAVKLKIQNYCVKKIK